MNKTSLLEFAKTLIITSVKTKEELEEAIKDTIKGYNHIIIGSDAPICVACLDKLRKQQIIDQKVYDGRYDEETRIVGTSKKYCDGL